MSATPGQESTNKNNRTGKVLLPSRAPQKQAFLKSHDEGVQRLPAAGANRPVRDSTVQTTPQMRQQIMQLHRQAGAQPPAPPAPAVATTTAEPELELPLQSPQELFTRRGARAFDW